MTDFPIRGFDVVARDSITAAQVRVVMAVACALCPQRKFVLSLAFQPVCPSGDGVGQDAVGIHALAPQALPAPIIRVAIVAKVLFFVLARYRFVGVDVRTFLNLLHGKGYLK